MKTWLVLICGAVVVAGCGQKGPLYLPDKNASVVTRPGASTSTSAPQQAPQGNTPEATPSATITPKKDQAGDDAQSSNSTPPKP